MHISKHIVLWSGPAVRQVLGGLFCIYYFFSWAKQLYEK